MNQAIIVFLTTWLLFLTLLLGFGHLAREQERAVQVFIGQAEPAARLLVVASREAEMLSLDAGKGILSALLLEGELPAEPGRATVLTDLNCNADDTWISRCTSDLQSGGTRFVVRHDHNMREEPCLWPGEQVKVVSLEWYLSQ